MTSAPKTSGLAIASLICGILGLVACPVSVAGLALGIPALVSIGKSDGRLGGKGLAIAGVVTSVIGLLLAPALLVALMLPAIGKARLEAKATIDHMNMRAYQTELAGYAALHDGHLPAGTVWRDAMIEAGGGAVILSSRGADDPRPAFSMNAAVTGKLLESLPADAVVLLECDPGGPAEGGIALLPAEPRHPQHGYLIGLANGTVAWIAPEEIGTLNWNASP